MTKLAVNMQAAADKVYRAILNNHHSH